MLQDHFCVFSLKLAIKSWHIIGDGLSIELVATEKGNRTTVIASLPELERSSLPVQSPVSELVYCFFGLEWVFQPRVKEYCCVHHTVSVLMCFLMTLTGNIGRASWRSSTPLLSFYDEGMEAQRH